MDEKRGVVLEYIIDEYVDEDDDVEVDFDTALISSGTSSNSGVER